MPSLDVELSIFRDGVSAFICTARWADGIEVTHGRAYWIDDPFGYVPDEAGIEAFEREVQANPEYWRDASKTMYDF